MQTTDAAALVRTLTGRTAALADALYDGAGVDEAAQRRNPGLPAEARQHAAYQLGTLLATLLESAEGGQREATALLAKMREGFDDEIDAPLAGVRLNACSAPVSFLDMDEPGDDEPDWDAIHAESQAEIAEARRHTHGEAIGAGGTVYWCHACGRHDGDQAPPCDLAPRGPFDPR